MIEKHIQKLNINPFLVGLIFQSFYNGYGREVCALNLHYIISPLIMYKDTCSLFSSITKNASLGKIIEENPIPLIELQTRIWKMRELTHLALINLHNQKKIELLKDVVVLETIFYEQNNSEFKIYLRSAHYLGILFKSFEAVDIYKIFKVIP
jgi:hypothetical protein